MSRSLGFKTSLALALSLCAGTGYGAAPRPSEAARHAQQVVSSISKHAGAVRTELRFARSRGDRVRIQCLSGKLSELHAQQRQANARKADLEAALAAGSERRVRENRVVLASLHSRARELFRQAQRCGV